MSKKLTDINRERALYDPETEFKSPGDLAREIGLTRGEKLAALRRWSFNVDRRLASGYEGMPTNGTEPADAELLRNIEMAREHLEHDRP
ncbi:MAG: hypothetical protein AB7S74_18115 [Hyphomicrobium sp.]